MPSFICECRAGLDLAKKNELARALTEVVHETILSPLENIAIIFHDLPSDSTFRAGKVTQETLILGNIRKGRRDDTVHKLGLRISSTWSRITGQSEDEIEIAIQLFDAKYTFRHGDRLPEAPVA